MTIDFTNIDNDVAGFNFLAELARRLDSSRSASIELNMSRVNWFAANMCSPLGAIMYRAGRALNSFTFVNFSAKVRETLSRNGFLSYYGWPSLPDGYGNMIAFSRFELAASRFFSQYVHDNLLNQEIPEMSVGLRKKFQESIFEIFSNAAIHSGTRHGVFACGQLFPKKYRLNFTITDLGIGMKENINGKLNLRLSPDLAIEWALTGANTTKRGPVPGGLGLKLLKEFITLNEGRMQIVSDRGYWELAAGKRENLMLMTYPFPGTVVNLEFNTADAKSYRLTSEIDSGDIF